MYALPNIDIAVSTDPREFLEHMAAIGEQSGQFNVERHFDAIGKGELDIINFRYLGASHHESLGGQLIRRAGKAARISVEMRARWGVPDPPDRESYCAAANELIRPLLKIYNGRFGTRYRLRISKPSSGVFRMSPGTKTLFERFAILANTRSLHPFDWRRFYALVREGRQEIPETAFRGLLVESGFTPERAAQLAEIYGHLWAYKQNRW